MEVIRAICCTVGDGINSSYNVCLHDDHTAQFFRITCIVCDEGLEVMYIFFQYWVC